MAMAVNCATSSSLLFTKPSEKPFSFHILKTTPFLGSSLATAPFKPSVQLTNKVSKICCQEKAALVPSGQQWMFDDIMGPPDDASAFLEAGGNGGWRPCMYFARGFYKNGGSCKFSHGGTLAM